MKLVVRVQRHLCIAHRYEDPGDWAFTICRAGLQQLTESRLRAGDTVVIDVVGKLLKSTEGATFMTDKKKRCLTIGVALTDDAPAWALGNAYANLDPVGVSALQSLLAKPAVAAAYNAFQDAFAVEAIDLGIEVARHKGADDATIQKIKAHREKK